MRLPSRMAARVGRRPTIPTIEAITVSAAGRAAASSRPSIPPSTRTPVSASRTRRSAAALSSASTASRGRNLRACSSSRATLELAVSATASMPQAAITSSDCRPMEPVDPKIVMFLLIAVSLYEMVPVRGQKAGASSTSNNSVGAANTMESNRSSIPPWPGRRWP